MILAMLWKYKGAISIVLVILGIVGYIWILKGKVERQEAVISSQDNTIAVLRGDVDTAGAAIYNMKAGMRQYQKLVQQAIETVHKSDAIIAEQNRQLQVLLDNLAVLAAAAKRIQDAPTIPFFMESDNMVRPAIVVSSDNGVYHYRMRP